MNGEVVTDSESDDREEYLGVSTVESKEAQAKHTTESTALKG